MSISKIESAKCLGLHLSLDKRTLSAQLGLVRLVITLERRSLDSGFMSHLSQKSRERREEREESRASLTSGPAIQNGCKKQADFTPAKQASEPGISDRSERLIYSSVINVISWTMQSSGVYIFSQSWLIDPTHHMWIVEQGLGLASSKQEQQVRPTVGDHQSCLRTEGWVRALRVCHHSVQKQNWIISFFHHLKLQGSQ